MKNEQLESLFEKMADMCRPKVETVDPVFLAARKEYDNRIFTDGSDTEAALCGVMFKKGTEWQKEQCRKLIEHLIYRVTISTQSLEIIGRDTPTLNMPFTIEDNYKTIIEAENFIS